MRFLHPEFLWLLLLIPVLAYFFGKRGAAPALLFSSTSIVGKLSSAKKRSLASFPYYYASRV